MGVFEMGGVDRKRGTDMLLSAMGDLYASIGQDGLHPLLQMFVSDNTNSHPLPSSAVPHWLYIQSARRVHGHLSVNNSTLLHLYIEWLFEFLH